MILDALLKVASAQAFGAAGVSASSIDLGNVTPKRKIGTGEPMSFVVTIDVAATVAAPIIDVISATDAALTTSVIVHASRTIPLAEAVAGAVFDLPVPEGTPTQRFLGIRITTAGGTVTASASLQPREMVSIPPENYARNYAI